MESTDSSDFLARILSGYQQYLQRPDVTEQCRFQDRSASNVQWSQELRTFTQQPSGFLNLPKEIRDEVYKHALHLHSAFPLEYARREGPWPYQPRRRNFRHELFCGHRPDWGLALLFVCKQLYTEAMDAFIRYNRADLHHIESFLEWYGYNYFSTDRQYIQGAESSVLRTALAMTELQVRHDWLVKSLNEPDTLVWEPSRTSGTASRWQVTNSTYKEILERVRPDDEVIKTLKRILRLKSELYPSLKVILPLALPDAFCSAAAPPLMGHAEGLSLWLQHLERRFQRELASALGTMELEIRFECDHPQRNPWCEEVIRCAKESREVFATDKGLWISKGAT